MAKPKEDFAALRAAVAAAKQAPPERNLTDRLDALERAVLALLRAAEGERG